MNNLFSRTTLENLTDIERKSRFSELEEILNRGLESITQHELFQKKIDYVIDELKRIGHDLWSWDYDGENYVWGGDYTNKENSGKLILEFISPNKVRVMWNKYTAR